MTISGVEITMSDLRPEDTTKPAFPSIISSVASLPPHPPYGQLPRASHSRSPSPDSDIDDETQMMMSQSIASLPPRPLPSSSMSASVASSMYHSAVSDAPFGSTTIHEPIPEAQEQPPYDPAAKPEEQPPPTPQDQPPLHDGSLLYGAGVPEGTIVSFGSDPIVIRLTTPPPSESRPGQQRVEKRDDSLRLSVTTGVLGFALSARHIQSLTELMATLGSISPASPSPPPKSRGTTITSSLLPRLNVSVHIRGVVGLLLLSKEPSYELTRVDFFHHQLIPPKLPHGYLRIHADGISASFSQPPGVGRGDRRTSGMTKVDASLTTTDLTVFLFEPSRFFSGLRPHRFSNPDH
jgi:autophagy-related protein 2